MSQLSEKIDLLLTGGAAVEGAKNALDEIKNSEVEVLTDSLKDLIILREEYDNNIKDADASIKNWQEAKKTWQEIRGALDGIFMDSLNHFNLKTLEKEGYRATLANRNVLEADEEFLLSPYKKEKESLQEKLPEYIDVKLSLNKAKLNRCVTTKMLEENPDKIHWTVNKNLKITVPA